MYLLNRWNAQMAAIKKRMISSEFQLMSIPFITSWNKKLRSQGEAGSTTAA